MSNQEIQFEDDSPAAAANKRKRDAENGQRSKRNRYIAIACNECKRRKIKCNGETPCQRCGNLKLDCVYEANCCSTGSLRNSTDFRQLSAHVTHLEEQIQYLLYNVNHLRSTLGQDDFPDVTQYQQAHQPQHDEQSIFGAAQGNMVIDPTLQGRGLKATSQQSRFQGPTSPAFSLGVAQHSLKHMGISSAEEAIEAGMLSGTTLQQHSPVTKKALHSSKDPIWSVSKEEALRLCKVFEDENGLMYPFLDMDQLMRHATLLYQFMEAAQKSFLASALLPGSDSLHDEDTDVLKLVLAIAMVTEGTGQSELGNRLFEQVNKTGDNRMLGSVNLKDIQILTLTAIYHFHSDDEGLAWRVIGMTARLCLELGLHRSETYSTKFPDERERIGAIKLFWSVYVLDHRWSMGTGMSFALQDADIDKNVPLPEESSYLATMISYSRIGAKVWKSVSSTDSSGAPSNAFSKEDAEYLDYQVIQWYQGIPKQLRFMHPESSGHPAQVAEDFNREGGRGLYRLKVLLYLRQNQMRITIYRPYLHSAASIASNLSAATTAVDVAKDMIRILRHVDQASDVYRTQQTTWNHFLLAALAVLALAVCHAPHHFSDSCREEFLLALEMIRGFSGNSYVSKRLWRTIRNLRELGTRLGGYNSRSGTQSNQSGNGNLAMQDQPQNDAQRSAAMAMAGLATGQPVDESAFFANNAHGITELNTNITRNDQGGQPITSPNGMANELTSLFEAAGVLGGSWSNFGGDIGSGQSQVPQGGMTGGDTRRWTAENEELGRILRELF